MREREAYMRQEKERFLEEVRGEKERGCGRKVTDARREGDLNRGAKERGERTRLG